ncbi:MAG: hypothetical protein D6816_00635 [Bacteroidetes bacterium]|nr:MAG: hypothetical protein D6816_00635 [Bacteroidota bacterium]
MSTKINIAQIIRDHLDTLRTYQGRRLIVQDVLFFYGIPVVLALGLVWMGLSITSFLSTILITSLSIFAALLFNLLLLAYDIVQRPDKGRQKLKRRFLKEAYANISYCILISLISVLVLLAFEILSPLLEKTGQAIFSACFEKAIFFIVYFLVIHFFLSLLMVLKRIHVMMSREFEHS